MCKLWKAVTENYLKCVYIIAKKRITKNYGKFSPMRVLKSGKSRSQIFVDEVGIKTFG